RLAEAWGAETRVAAAQPLAPEAADIIPRTIESVGRVVSILKSLSKRARFPKSALEPETLALDSSARRTTGRASAIEPESLALKPEPRVEGKDPVIDPALETVKRPGIKP